MEYSAQITAIAALAVVVVHTILKLNVIPIYVANKYPVLTNIALSLVASVVVSWNTALTLTTVWQWVSYVGTVSVLAAVTYNMTLRNSASVVAATNKTQ